MKKLAIAVLLILVVSVGFIAFKEIQKPPAREIISSFTACGCGGCGGTEAEVKEIENTPEGKQTYDKFKERAAHPPSGEECATVGCSICVEYRLIEA